MIQEQTLIEITDNSGVRLAKCIKVLGGSKKKIAKIGDIIKVSVKTVHFNSKIKKSQIFKALIIRTKFIFNRKNGEKIKFNDNSAILLQNNEQIIATRVFGAIIKEIKSEKFSKLISLSNEII
ncbi:ribosomal protein L14 [Candidatus Carsonella ruddii CS isolate Thao2000]|uniref:Large ribosomal subunit protein uL14 n=1 Tax=Candidatus Carsonella ruddii CS isolate Thao2000 TaxID=1202537 RepID=J7H0I1_CARRU|nr:50S ribosomal protein L14 [Candidatus Carsonella ruddii]AFP83820.1 ribosomal protein L14 [Candidatus Carsonella ruddii CS isolate Thao2000]